MRFYLCCPDFYKVFSMYFQRLGADAYLFKKKYLCNIEGNTGSQIYMLMR
jgi:hypothetical protein